MFHPPSLPTSVLVRAFRAGNGELGLLLDDASTFLDVCEADGVLVYGWELWVVDHLPNEKFATLKAAPGYWSGMIPITGSPLPHVIHGEGDLAEIRQQVSALDKDLAEVDPRWVQHVRINFTLE